MTGGRKSMHGESLAEKFDALDEIDDEIQELRRDRWRLRTVTVIVGVTAANIVWGLGAGFFTRVVAGVALTGAAAWVLAWIFVERAAGRALSALEGRREQLGQGT